MQKVSIVLQLLAACKDDDSYVVWSMVADVLKALGKLLLDDDELHGLFDKFAESVLAGAAVRCGWDPKASDGHLGKMLRSVLVGLQGKFMAEEETVLAEARGRFQKLAKGDVGALPAEYKVAAFKIVLKASASKGKNEFDQLLKFYAEAESNIEKKHIMHAIGAVSLEPLLTFPNLI